jgi:hypothetical protein
MESPLRLHFIPKESVLDWWPSIEPLVDKCITQAFHGEMDSGDVLDSLTDGRMVAGVGMRDDCIEYVCAFEEIIYPKLRVAHCVISASARPGAFVDLMQGGEWSRFKDSVRNLGYDAISFCAPAGAARLYTSIESGFKQLHTAYRLDLR